MARQRTKGICLGLSGKAVIGRCIGKGDHCLVGFTGQTEGQRQVNNAAVAIRPLQIGKGFVDDLTINQRVKRKGVDVIGPACAFAAETQRTVAAHQRLRLAVGVGNFDTVIVDAVKAHLGVFVGVDNVERPTGRGVVPVHRVSDVDNLVRVGRHGRVVDFADFEVHDQGVRGAVEVLNVNGQLFALQSVFCSQVRVVFVADFFNHPLDHGVVGHRRTAGNLDVLDENVRMLRETTRGLIGTGGHDNGVTTIGRRGQGSGSKRTFRGSCG